MHREWRICLGALATPRLETARNASSAGRKTNTAKRTTNGAVQVTLRTTGTSVATRVRSGARARQVQRFGRVILRWVVRDETVRFFRALERAFTRVSSRICRQRASFLRFLCENFCRIWSPALRREKL